MRVTEVIFLECKFEMNFRHALRGSQLAVLASKHHDDGSADARTRTTLRRIALHAGHSADFRSTAHPTSGEVYSGAFYIPFLLLLWPDRGSAVWSWSRHLRPLHARAGLAVSPL